MEIEVAGKHLYHFHPIDGRLVSFKDRKNELTPRQAKKKQRLMARVKKRRS